MEKYYKLKVAGLERDLPIFKIKDDLSIAGFVIFGDVELTVACARELIKIMPEHDVIITAEAKGITLAHEMARLSGQSGYVVARKAKKLYMVNPFTVRVHSITTDFEQNLVLDEGDVALMRGKRVLIVDDVISTGESLNAIEKLVETAGGNIVGRMAVFAEGNAQNRDDILFLQHLPLFNAKGEIVE